MAVTQKQITWKTLGEFQIRNVYTAYTIYEYKLILPYNHLCKTRIQWISENNVIIPTDLNWYRIIRTAGLCAT